MNSLRNHPWTLVLVVAYALFMDYLMYGLVVPLTPYSPSGVSGQRELGMLYGGYAAGILIATPIFGHLGDKQGCRKPMLYGVLLMIASIALFSFGSNFYHLLLARILQGTSAAASWTAGLALVAERYNEKRVQMMGVAMIGSTAGSTIGPSLGAWLYQLGGYNLPFMIAGVLVSFDFCFRKFLLPKSNPSRDSGPYLKQLLLDKSIIVAALAVALSASGWGLIEPLLPDHLEKTEHAEPQIIGPMFTVATLAYGLMAQLVSYCSERLSVRKTICLGMLGMSLTLPLLAVFPTPVLTGAMLCLVSMAYAFVLNPTSAELGNAVDRRGLNCYAAVYAVYNIAYSAGMMGSDLFAATIGEHLAFMQSLLCMSALFVIFIPLIWIGFKQNMPPPVVPASTMQNEI